MKTILVIDDNEDLNEMIVEILTMADYYAVGVTTGKDGMKMMTEIYCDMVITDLVMPDTEGLEIISSIRKKNVTVPIIAISGGGEVGPESYLEIALALGANATLQKPFLAGQILSAVRECFNGKSVDEHFLSLKMCA
jgi:DNA-binding response OmpR family regulator